MNEEKSKKIQSIKFPEICLYFDDEIGCYLFEIKNEAGKVSNEDFNLDNDEFAFEIFKVLNEANKRGLFDKYKKNEDGEIEEKIYV